MLFIVVQYDTPEYEVLENQENADTYTSDQAFSTVSAHKALRMFPSNLQGEKKNSRKCKIHKVVGYDE